MLIVLFINKKRCKRLGIMVVETEYRIEVNYFI